MFRTLPVILLLLAAVNVANALAQSELYPIEEQGRWGFIDGSGKVVLPPGYQAAAHFAEGLAPVRIGKMFGYIDVDGRIAIRPQFDEARFFYKGIAPVRKGQLWGYIRRAGQFAIPLRYELVRSFQDDVARVKLHGKWGYIDLSGAFVIGPSFDDANGFKGGLAPVRLGPAWGFIDKRGLFVIPAKFEFAHSFGDELADVKLGGKWGFVDRTGSMMIPAKFDETGEMSDGLAPARQGALWGYIRPDGSFAIAPQFESAKPFDAPLAEVKVRGHMGYINRTGKVIWQSSSSGPGVKIALEKEKAVVSINGQPFSSLYPGVDVNRPYLYPLLTASGKRVTRGYPMETIAGEPTDHPHQRGLFVATQNLGGSDFWENDPTYKRPNPGRIIFKSWLGSASGAHEGSLSFEARWLGHDGQFLVTEKRVMTFYAEPRDSRMFDVEVTFTARQPVVFEDNHDAIIGVRLGPAFDPKNGGRAVNAEGLQNQAEIRAQKSAWVDWQAVLDGEPIGFALMDHPSNPKFPARWNFRDYGLLLANPFGDREFFTGKPSPAHELGYKLAAGESIHLRYRVLIHPESADIRAAFQQFALSPTH